MKAKKGDIVGRSITIERTKRKEAKLTPKFNKKR